MAESGKDQLRALAQEEETRAIPIEVLVGVEILAGLGRQAQVDVGRRAVR